MTGTVVAQAPGRVNLMGEHTDYNRGLCLPIAIPYLTTARATRRSDSRLRITSAQQSQAWEATLDDSGPGRVTDWAAYVAGVLWCLREAGHDLPGMNVEIDSTVPVGAGLSSSAALEAAVAVAAVALIGRPLDDALRHELVDVCCRAEYEFVGAPTGGLDQRAVLLSQEGCALLLDFNDDRVTPIPFQPDKDGVSLVVIDTHVSHTLTDGEYGARRSECETAATTLGLKSLRHADAASLERLQDDVLRRRTRHVVTENARVLESVAAIRGRKWERLGQVFNESHSSMRDDFEISCPELDLAVHAAVNAGALGARMTGGGFGGSAIALVPSDLVDVVRREVDIAFARAGFAPPGHLDGTASGPAAAIAT